MARFVYRHPLNLLGRNPYCCLLGARLARHFIDQIALGNASPGLPRPASSTPYEHIDICARAAIRQSAQRCKIEICNLRRRKIKPKVEPENCLERCDAWIRNRDYSVQSTCSL